MKTPALFIDIDRVLIREIESSENTGSVRLIRSAGKALSEINSLSIPVISILKLPKKYYTEKIINKTAFEKEFKRKLTRNSARTDAIYFCDECARTMKKAKFSTYKPDGSVFKQAAEKFNIDLKKCWLVTDSPFSLLTAKSLELFGKILIQTSNGKKCEKHLLDEKIDLESLNFEVFSNFNIARSVLKKSLQNLLDNKSESIKSQNQEVLKD